MVARTRAFRMRRIAARAEEIGALLLPDWKITCSFMDEAEESDTHDVYAYVQADWQYLTLHITFYPPIYQKYDTDLRGLDEAIIHELMHGAVNEMREYSAKRHNETLCHEERVVSGLTGMVMKLLTMESK